MKIYNDITVDLYDLYPLKKVEAQQNNVGRGARITLTAGWLGTEPGWRECHDVG